MCSNKYFVDGHQEKWITVYRKQNRIVFDASLGNQRGIFCPNPAAQCTEKVKTNRR